jgi:2-polyprenyl-6-methoxyphenol hydroxylase-like FAD-dependent oxidoreductase
VAGWDIVIVGAGIGGLTAAIALGQRGFPVRVFETAPELAEAGAGIWVPPNAMEVLRRLGIAEEVRRAGTPIVRAQVADYRRGPLQTIETRTDAGGPTIAIRRTELQRVLAGHVPAESLILDARCTALGKSGARPCVFFSNRECAEADVVIGADGLRSTVRQSLFPGVRLRYSGQTSWRAVTPFTLPPRLDGMSWEVWAPGCRFGLSSIGSGNVYWYATADAPHGEAETVEGRRTRLTKMAAQFPEPIPALIAATDLDRAVRTDLWDFAPIESWHKGRVGLVGDAAHAMTPNLGQGGAQAIEDAWVIAEELSSCGDVEQGLARFEAARRAKARLVVNRARQVGRMAHMSGPLARALRNSLLRLAPDWMTRRETRAIYAPPGR